jgi:phosphomannomutase/phosphoglucomutase
MKETGAVLGGEMSGHIFFAHRYLGFDDAVYAGARLLEILSKTRAPLSELRDTLPEMVNTPEIRVECPDDAKFDVVARAKNTLRSRSDVTAIVDVDGIRAHFKDGWGLIRASNTQPAIVVRCEATTRARLTEIQKIVESAIEAAKNAS